MDVFFALLGFSLLFLLFFSPLVGVLLFLENGAVINRRLMWLTCFTHGNMS